MFRKKRLNIAKRIALISYIAENEDNLRPDSFALIIEHLAEVASLCGGEKMINTVQLCLKELRERSDT